VGQKRRLLRKIGDLHFWASVADGQTIVKRKIPATPGDPAIARQPQADPPIASLTWHQALSRSAQVA